MKKSLFVLASLFLLGIMVHAQETGSVYLNMFNSENDFSTYSAKAWDGYDNYYRRMITVNITASPEAPAKVFITNYVDHVATNEYGDPYGVVTDLGADDYLKGYDMGSGKYGYVMAEIDDNGNATPILSTLKMADGTHKTVNYTYTADGREYPVQTEGYYLDEFTEDAKIFLIMTPRGFDEAVNTYDPVSPTIETELLSRQLNTVDHLNYTRVNLGLTDGSHEFVIGYQAPTSPVTGSPLPGSLLSSLVFMGTAAFGSRFRKRSKK